MSVKPVESHPGTIVDVKSAVTWYRKRSPKAALDFIDELHRASDTIREALERWPLGKRSVRETLIEYLSQRMLRSGLVFQPLSREEHSGARSSARPSDSANVFKFCTPNCLLLWGILAPL